MASSSSSSASASERVGLCMESSSNSSASSSKREELRINVVKNVISGSMAVPVCLALQNVLPKAWIPIALFAGSVLGTAVSTFIECVFKNECWKVTAKETLVAGGSFVLGGLVPMFCGMMINYRPMRIGFLVFTNGIVTASAIHNWRIKSGSSEYRQTKIWIWWIWFVAMIGTAAFVTIADRAK